MTRIASDILQRRDSNFRPRCSAIALNDGVTLENRPPRLDLRYPRREHEPAYGVHTSWKSYFSGEEVRSRMALPNCHDHVKARLAIAGLIPVI
jgi:hypothetical protein